LTQAQRQAEIVAATAKGKVDAARAQAEGEADGARDSLATASCANRSQVRGQQIREHSADCAMLKIVLGESKVARMAPRAVFSHRKKTRLGGHFHL
jgi:hypothetical protein